MVSAVSCLSWWVGRGGPNGARVTSPNLSAPAQPCPHNQPARSAGAKALSSLSPTPASRPAPEGRESPPPPTRRPQVSPPLDLLVFGSRSSPPLLLLAMSVSVRSVLRLDVLLLTAACWSTCSPLGPHRPADKPLLDARDLLSHFLSSMNLTARRPQRGPPAAQREPPEYMLELYRRFVQDHTAAASASVVRSFNNQGRTSPCFTLHRRFYEKIL